MTGYTNTIREITAEIGHVGSDPWVIEGWLRLDPATGSLRCLDGMSRATMRTEIREIVDELATIPVADAEAVAASIMGPRS